MRVAVDQPDSAKTAGDAAPVGEADKAASRRRGGRRTRKEGDEAVAVVVEAQAVPEMPAEPAADATPARRRGGRKPARKAEGEVPPAVAAPVTPEAPPVAAKSKPGRRPARSRKAKGETGGD